ncbi:hypothetical protein [Nonomuraea dietziae]|uniref:hypothetical protein n=1 Tax=Nonomuraea dietziae TaxID=65515 RepID=UPI0031D7716A
MTITAMIRPVATAEEAVELPIATPPAAEPNAMPTLTAEAGSDCASAPPGPATRGSPPAPPEHAAGAGRAGVADETGGCGRH